MRVLIFAALSASVFAAEFSVQSSVLSLRNALNTVDSSRDSREGGIVVGRKMIVEKMLDQIEAMGTLSPASKALLTTAAGVIRGILTLLTTERDGVNTALAALVSAFADCVIAASHTEIGTRDTAANDARTAHTDCRVLWVTQQGTFTTECTALHTIVAAIASGLPANNQNGCDRSGLNAHQSDGDAWEAMATHGHNQIVVGTHSKTAYDAAALACGNANNAVVSTEGNCDTLQAAYELAYCSWGTYLTTTCNTQNACHDGAVSNLAAANAAEVAPSAQRVVDAAVIETLACLIDELASATPPTDYATWEANCATVRNADYSAYACNTPSAPARPACDYTPNGALHGDDVWDYDTNAAWYSRLATQSDCNFPAATH